MTFSGQNNYFWGYFQGYFGGDPESIPFSHFRATFTFRGFGASRRSGTWQLFQPYSETPWFFASPSPNFIPNMGSLRSQRRSQRGGQGTDYGWSRLSGTPQPRKTTPWRQATRIEPPPPNCPWKGICRACWGVSRRFKGSPLILQGWEGPTPKPQHDSISSTHTRVLKRTDTLSTNAQEASWNASVV